MTPVTPPTDTAAGDDAGSAQSDRYAPGYAPDWALHGGGKRLERHLLVSHRFDGVHLDIAPTAGLAWEHLFDHEDGVPDGVEHAHIDPVAVDRGDVTQRADTADEHTTRTETA